MEHDILNAHTSPRRRRLLSSSGASLILIALLIAAGACSPPTVNLKRADLNKITTTGFKVLMSLNVFNPNSYTLPLRTVGWNLELFERPFTKGSVNTSHQITAQHNAEVEVPLGIRFSTVSLGIRDLMAGRDIPWGIQGQCAFDTPLGPISANFARKGAWASPLQKGIKLGQSHEELPAVSTRQELATVTVSVPQVEASPPAHR